jgi:pyruvate kinase
VLRARETVPDRAAARSGAVTSRPMPRSTKIVATLGPACSKPEVLQRMLAAGVDVVRLNFSHGAGSDHVERARLVREVARAQGREVSIMADLQGPKIRIGRFAEGKVELVPGARFILDADCETGDATRVGLDYRELVNDVGPGSVLLLDDGLIKLDVETVDGPRIVTRVVLGGILSNNKGINRMGGGLTAPALTPKDMEDMKTAAHLEADYLAVSFPKSKEDMYMARQLMRAAGGKAMLIAKIERAEAIPALEEIIDASDGIMVARGDLAVEVGNAAVPGLQKRMLRAARERNKITITATQMMESMIHNPVPTRAEVSDVATAIFEGADAVMLSAESAAGQYPVEAVAMMDKIIGKTEAHEFYRRIVTAIEPDVESTPSHVVAGSAADIADRLGATVIAAFTSSGVTAARIARQRPVAPIVALTPHEAIARRLCLFWGAHSVLSADIHSYEEMVQRATQATLDEGFASANRHIVIVGGIPFGEAGTTNNLRVVQIAP